MEVSFYIEISDSAMNESPYNGNKYFVRHTRLIRNMSPHIVPISHKHVYSATRVWQEENSTVKYLKNRFESEETPVDLKEFMWIKLKAQQL